MENDRLSVKPVQDTSTNPAVIVPEQLAVPSNIPATKKKSLLFHYARRLFLSTDASRRSTNFYNEFTYNRYLTAADGTKIGAFFYEPPLINNETNYFLVCHGKGCDRYELNIFISPAELAVTHNICILVIDYRGFADSDGEFDVDEVNLDVLAGFEFLHKYSEGKPIFLVGHSLGGAVSIEYGRYSISNNLKHQPAFIYSIAAFSTTLAVCEDYRLFRFLTFLIPGLRQLVRDGFNHDSIAAAKIIGDRMMVIHGINDGIVEIYHGREIANTGGCEIKETKHNHISIFRSAKIWEMIVEDSRKRIKVLKEDEINRMTNSQPN